MKKVIGVILALISFALIGCQPGRVKRANELIEVGSLDQAITLLEEEITENPKNADAYIAYGIALRKKGDYGTGLEKFKSAVKSSSVSKEKIIQIVLADENSTYADLDFLNEIEPSLVRENEDFAWRYLVTSGMPSEAAKFAEYFPQSAKAPEAIACQAEFVYENGDFDTAKSLYERAANNYPNSLEGENAKEKLSDWWIFMSLNIPIDGTWRGIPIKKGQAFTYHISGEIVISLGVFGIERVNGEDVEMFIGSHEDLEFVQNPRKNEDYMKERWKSISTRKEGPLTKRLKQLEKDKKEAGFNGRGIAPRGGLIWFHISGVAGMEYPGSLTVTVRLKES